MENLNTSNFLEAGAGITLVKTEDRITIHADPLLSIYTALGSVIKAQSFPLNLADSSSAMLDGRFRFTAIYLPTAQTLTGVKVFPTVTGNYTGDNNNRVGLYSYSGGTMTLVASCANSATLWQSAASAIQTIAFSSTYAAAAGLYFVGMVYNNSAQVTAPVFAGITATDAGQMSADFTNSAKVSGLITGQTDLPATQAMSGVTATSFNTWVALY